MSTLYPALVYENSELNMMLFNVYDHVPYLLAKKLIHSGSIKSVVSESEIKKLARRVDDAIIEFEREFSMEYEKIYCVIEPENYYYTNKAFTVEFKDEHTIVKEDFDKIIAKAMRQEEEKEGFSIANFTMLNVEVDDVKAAQAIGKQGKKITVQGELVFVDEPTFYPLERIIADCRSRLSSFIVSSHLLKYASQLESNQAIIEFESNKMNVLVKSEKSSLNFTIEFGIGNLFEKMYIRLLEKFPAAESEKYTRYIQNYFMLQLLEHNQVIDEKYNVTANDVINVFRTITYEYMNSIFAQIKKQGVNLQKVYSITYEYSNNEWVNFMNELFEIEFERFKIPKYNNIQKKELKTYYAIAYFDSSKKY